MAKTTKSLDDLFGEYEAEQEEQAKRDDDPATIARREAQRKAEIEKEIRQGLRDENGDWIEQPEADDVDEDQDDEGNDDDA